jgi:hypothetical protein
LTTPPPPPPDNLTSSLTRRTSGVSVPEVERGGVMGGVLRFSMVGLIAAVVSTGAPSAEGQPGCFDCRAADAHAAFATFYDLQSFEASLILKSWSWRTEARRW